MFDVGFLELMLIGVVALVVVGPERLPDVARTVGTWVNKTQRFIRGVKSDLASEMRTGELKDLLGDQRKQINELRQMVQSTQRELEQSTSDAMRSTEAMFHDLEESAADAGIVKPRHPARKQLSTDKTDKADKADKPGGADEAIEASQSTTAGQSGDGQSAPAATSADTRTAQPEAGEPASDAVSRPVNTGPQPGSWASGEVPSGAGSSATDEVAGNGRTAGRSNGAPADRTYQDPDKPV